MSEVLFKFGEHTVNRDGGLFFIFEMANNHQGDVQHGLSIIRAISKIIKSRNIQGAIKFQFRQLDNLLHPGFLDSDFKEYSNKHVKRFVETRLNYKDYKLMANEALKNKLIPIATPFDEHSVDWCDTLDFPVIKIASSSANDWPLLHRVAESNRNVVYSTADVSIGQIDEVVNYFNKYKTQITILHCVGIYPTPSDKVQLDQIRQLRERYKDLVIGYSAHESPKDIDIVKLAVASGASILERHVGLATKKVSLNKYSLSPKDLERWIDSALQAHSIMSAGKRRVPYDKETNSLNELKRGIYSRVNKNAGEFLKSDDIFLAMPCLEGQFNAGEIDSVIGLPLSHEGISINMPIMKFQNTKLSPEVLISVIKEKIRSMLNEAKITLSDSNPVEISHPYGMDKFNKYGCVIIDIVNREYCKKIILQFPGQIHPAHKHIQKEETFQVLKGQLEVHLENELKVLSPGDSLVIKRNQIHSFKATKDLIMEEISTTHIIGDSIYEDQSIPSDPVTRKTKILI